MTADSSPQISEVTGLLMAWGEGDRDAKAAPTFSASRLH